MPVLQIKDNSPVESKGGVISIDIKKANLDTGVIEGVASEFKTIDSYGDLMVRGSFEGAKAGDVRMLAHHDPSRPIGKWTSIKETDAGLIVRGKLTKGVKDADEMLALLKDGAIDGLSIGYRVKEFDVAEHPENKEKTIRRIKKVDLWEISLVTFPANSRTRMTSVKSKPTKRDIEKALKTVNGISAKEAKAATARVFQDLERDAKADQSKPDDLSMLAKANEALAQAVQVINTLNKLSGVPLDANPSGNQKRADG